MVANDKLDMPVKDTKENYSKLVLELIEQSIDDKKYSSKGGTKTKDLYLAVCEFMSANVPEKATKGEVARIAIDSVGGDPDLAVSSRGGTETKATLKELYYHLVELIE